MLVPDALLPHHSPRLVVPDGGRDVGELPIELVTAIVLNVVAFACPRLLFRAMIISRAFYTVGLEHFYRHTKLSSYYAADVGPPIFAQWRSFFHVEPHLFSQITTLHLANVRLCPIAQRERGRDTTAEEAIQFCSLFPQLLRVTFEHCRWAVDPVGTEPGTAGTTTTLSSLKHIAFIMTRLASASPAISVVAAAAPQAERVTVALPPGEPIHPAAALATLSVRVRSRQLVLRCCFAFQMHYYWALLRASIHDLEHLVLELMPDFAQPNNAARIAPIRLAQFSRLNVLTVLLPANTLVFGPGAMRVWLYVRALIATCPPATETVNIIYTYETAQASRIRAIVCASPLRLVRAAAVSTRTVKHLNVAVGKFPSAGPPNPRRPPYASQSLFRDIDELVQGEATDIM